MATNLAIDDELLNEAKLVGGFKTKRETVAVALQDFIQKRKLEEFLALRGTIEFDPDYNYKNLRRNRRHENSN